jgi:hypothetical protein
LADGDLVEEEDESLPIDVEDTVLALGLDSPELEAVLLMRSDLLPEGVIHAVGKTGSGEAIGISDLEESDLIAEFVGGLEDSELNEGGSTIE